MFYYKGVVELKRVWGVGVGVFIFWFYFVIEFDFFDKELIFEWKGCRELENKKSLDKNLRDQSQVWGKFDHEK